MIIEFLKIFDIKNTYQIISFWQKKNLKPSGASNLKGQITGPESSFDISGADNLPLKSNTIRCRIEESGTSKTQFQVKEKISLHIHPVLQKPRTPGTRSSSPCTLQEPLTSIKYRPNPPNEKRAQEINYLNLHIHARGKIGSRILPPLLASLFFGPVEICRLELYYRGDNT